MKLLPRCGIRARNGNEPGDKITVQDDGQNKSAAFNATGPVATSDRAVLLCESDPAPVTMLRVTGRSPFVLVADHGGRAIPLSLGDLGVAQSDRVRHIAWDIGVAGMGLLLARSLDAALVTQNYSRLVIDCNRRPGHATSMAERSDGTPVPGNQALGEAARRARVREIFTPYHDRIASLLDARGGAGREAVLVALHSFTPRLCAEPAEVLRPCGAGERPWQVGVLHNHDPRLALILRDLLLAEGDLVVGDNEPYALSDEDDYTVPVHGEARGLPHVEIEVRQDLIADAAGEAAWAARLARLLPEAWARYQVAHA